MEVQLCCPPRPPSGRIHCKFGHLTWIRFPQHPSTEIYNAHTEPLFKQLNIMKLEDSFSLKCLKFYHKFNTNSLPKYFANIFTRNSEIHSYGTRSRDQLHYFPFEKTGASKCLRHSVPNLLTEIAPNVLSKFNTLSLEGFSSFYKTFVVSAYDPVCHVRNCYICKKSIGISHPR